MSGQFDGSSSMLETYRRVRSNCGKNAAWLTIYTHSLWAQLFS